ncbi:putative F-box protein At1g71320 [Papaver somniferum]|uniref:putative F-box protein At1g71320 n=1 Tax=Papaver somniferum TaxID=3469 RepID=UPI000E6FB20D|nr:putative F-box protein At1g71320 [Papaver somniferum]
MVLKLILMFNKKGKSTTRTVEYGHELPDDVLLKIFFHLPLKSVYKFRCVSKVWLSLLSNPCFVNKQATIRSLPWASLDCIDFDGIKLVCPKTRIDSYDGFTFKFMLNINPFKETVPKLRVLDSSDGLVLCSHWDSSRLLSRYYICNPVTKQWVSLPSPQAAVTYYPRGIECLSSTSLDHTKKTTYKVVIIPCFDYPKTEFDLQVFSSDTGEWNTYRVLSAEGVCTSYRTHNRNGYLFWIDNDKVRIYNLNNIDDKKLSSSGGGWMQSIDFPSKGGKNGRYTFHKLGISEGFIVYGVHKRLEQTLSIWVLKEEYILGGWVWQSVHKNINVEHSSGSSHKFFYFCPVNLDIVIFSDSDHLCCFNLQTADCETLVQFPALFSAIEGPRYLNYTPKPTIIP